MRRREFLAAPVAAGKGARIRVGVLGIAHSHADGKLRALRELGEFFEIAGVAEADAELRRQRENSTLYQGVRWMSERELLEDASIRLIVVETRVPELPEAGAKVIAAGKHLHLEKPPSHEPGPFRRLIEEARRKNLLVQTGYIWRFHPAMQAAFEAARNGWLGRVYMMRGVINTDLDARQREAPARYRGGMMFELGGHLIDRAVALWGRPRQVRCWLRHDTGFDDRLADNTLAVLEYDQGVAVISSAATMPNAFPHRSLELIGTEGAVVLQPIEPGTRLRVNLRQARGPYKAGWQEVAFPEHRRYVGDFRDMARALTAGEPLTYSYEHELLMHETLLRASGHVG